MNPFKGIELPIDYEKASPQMRKTVREEYVRKQDGKCHHCQEDLHGPPSKYIQNKLINEKLFPQGFFNNPIHLHHDHHTGMTIGAVHARCNAYLWQYHNQ